MVVSQATQNFERSLPCHKCRFAPICKHKSNIKAVEIPDFLEVKVTCIYQKELSNPVQPEAEEEE